MPKLNGLSERQRRFCANHIAGMTQDQAMIEAGYSVHTARCGMATKMVQQPYIQEEIARLRAMQAKRLNISIDSLILDLHMDREHCRRLDRPEGAANITVKMATLLGFMKDKLPGDVTIINKPLAVPSKQIEMSVDEWVAKWSPKEIEHHPTGNGHDGEDEVA